MTAPADWGDHGEPGSMTAPDDRAPAGRCDADIACLRAPCFQVQLETPRQVHCQANACAHHVADVIQAVRDRAARRGLTDGQLIILAIEPAAGGRQPGLRGFPFSTIPLTPMPRRDPEPAE